MRNSKACPVGVGVSVNGDAPSERDAELLSHEIRAGDLFGDRVLHLQAGVHLEKGDRAVCGEQELDGSRTAVLHLGADRSGRVVESRALVTRQPRRRGLLDELLIASLHGAVPVAHHHDAAESVAEHLHLDVTRALEEPLDEALAAAEGGDGLAHRRFVELGHLVEPPRDLEAAAAAAEGRLDRAVSYTHLTLPTILLV